MFVTLHSLGRKEFFFRDVLAYNNISTQKNADANEDIYYNQDMDLEIVPTSGEFYTDYQNVADALGILHHPSLSNDSDSPGLFECCIHLSPLVFSFHGI